MASVGLGRARGGAREARRDAGDRARARQRRVRSCPTTSRSSSARSSTCDAARAASETALEPRGTSRSGCPGASRCPISSRRRSSTATSGRAAGRLARALGGRERRDGLDALADPSAGSRSRARRSPLHAGTPEEAAEWGATAVELTLQTRRRSTRRRRGRCSAARSSRLGRRAEGIAELRRAVDIADASSTPPGAGTRARPSRTGSARRGTRPAAESATLAAREILTGFAASLAPGARRHAARRPARARGQLA